MFGFKCKHPFESLIVEKDETVEPSPKYPRDFNHVTYHLHCYKCGEKLNIKYAQSIRTTKKW